MQKEIQELIDANMHFGYRRTRRSPSMLKFVNGQKGAIDIIDLEKTLEQMNLASDLVEKVAKSGRQVLFVGGKNEARKLVANSAKKISSPFVAGRWIGGTLTNFAEMQKRKHRLESLNEEKEKGILEERYTKKERVLLERERGNLEIMFGGVVSMKTLPGLLVVIDPRHENTAVREAKRMKIEIVALANTDCDIKGLTVAVPGNDASQKSIQFFLSKMVDSLEKGVKAKRPEIEVKQA